MTTLEQFKKMQVGFKIKVEAILECSCPDHLFYLLWELNISKSDNLYKIADRTWAKSGELADLLNKEKPSRVKISFPKGQTFTFDDMEAFIFLLSWYESFKKKKPENINEAQGRLNTGGKPRSLLNQRKYKTAASLYLLMDDKPEAYKLQAIKDIFLFFEIPAKSLKTIEYFVNQGLKNL